MGTLFRSQEMTLCQMFLQSESAYACMAELGELGLAEFRDLNPDVNSFQRKFTNELRRCDNMERILEFLKKEIEKDGIPLAEIAANPVAPMAREIVDLEASLEKIENEMQASNVAYETLRKNFLELTEMKHVLSDTKTFFDEAHQTSNQKSARDEHDGLLPPSPTPRADTPLEMQTRTSLQLRFVAGVILRERIPAFERMLWRVGRGTVFLRHTEIIEILEDPHTGHEVSKSVILTFFQGDELKSRVTKICQAFHATMYPCPDDTAERHVMANGVSTRIADLTTIINQTHEHRRQVLSGVAKNFNTWSVKVRKMKAIYYALNLFNLDVTQKCLIGECWCPVSDLEQIRSALHRGTEQTGTTAPTILHRLDTSEVPPTFNKTNKFTSGYQGIVDAYGVGNYREVNPTPFIVVTFPFLFAVMFGDAGHGAVMTFLAFMLVWKEQWFIRRNIDGEIFQTIFGGRYIILMMGIFSIYTGFIYNDVFSKSVNIFGSRWTTNRTVYDFSHHDAAMEHAQLTLDPIKDFKPENGPYPFGIDPTWAMGKNKIAFINSFKMKMSVVFGVLQMLFGIGLSCFNHVYFGKMINVYCEFIPQVLFLLCMFGYLVALIFYKWIQFNAHASGCAPSLLIGLINMFLNKYEDNPPRNSDGTECLLNQFYPNQKSFQSVIVLVALICVPWMLCVKPVIMFYRSKKMKSAIPLTNMPEENSDEGSTGTVEPSIAATSHVGHDDHGGSGESFDFGNVMIYQAIHTIEFCLGIISNTASYLRLWALSLAHAQLSEVLWTMVMNVAFNMNGWGGIPMVFFVFAAWAGLTLAILVFMEGMSAFLHALRLHWVEFQNKFYGGQGYAFQPFSFVNLLERSNGATDND